MKVRYNRITNKQHQDIHSEVTKEFAKHLKTYNREAAMQVLHILHFDFGFGQARLQRFADKLTEMQAYQKERYELPDSDTPWLCEKQLTEDGINVEELFAEGVD